MGAICLDEMNNDECEFIDDCEKQMFHFLISVLLKSVFYITKSI